MGLARTYYYIVDRLTPQNAPTLKRALGTVTDIRSVEVRLGEGLVEAVATRDVESDVRVACAVAGTTFRTRIARRHV